MKTNTHKAPQQLADAWARIEQAHDNYLSFGKAIHHFWYEYIGGMLKGFDVDTDNFVLQLRHPKENEVIQETHRSRAKLWKTCVATSGTRMVRLSQAAIRGTSEPADSRNSGC